MSHKNDQTTISKTGESDRCKDKTPLFVRRISAKSPKHMNSTTSQGSPEGPVKIRFLFYMYIVWIHNNNQNYTTSRFQALFYL